MDALDQRLNNVFAGRVVRKDLLHRIKKGTNIPTFVLEFLLARYCASDDPAEIQAGMEAVLATLQDNYVRPDEANAAQSRVATKGKHRFIDKVHVRYVEKEKRHWAALENFASQRIAIGEKFYRDNDRLLEGGIWAEVTITHNDVDADTYAFYVEELRPIQLSRFDFGGYADGRKEFSRDDWMDVILRSVGLEPSKLTKRLKFHFMARLAPLVEANFNFIELGPRGTGKSYFFSEFSPYSTLISGGQATKAVLFYNNARHKIGLVGFWDTVAFDEVAGIRIKDPDTIQIMKDYMANGRFSRGVEVIADASMAFVGNIDQSVEQIVKSTDYDLFLPSSASVRSRCHGPIRRLHTRMGDAQEQQRILDGQLRPHNGLPGGGFPLPTETYESLRRGQQADSPGLRRSRDAMKRVSRRPSARFSNCSIQTVSPTDDEFTEYVEYAVEVRRRVKEQMNKRKPDDEFAQINLSYINLDGSEVIVFCPESRHASATLDPVRKNIAERVHSGGTIRDEKPSAHAPSMAEEPKASEKKSATIQPLEESHFTILYGDTGHTYESIMGPYLDTAKVVTVEDPYIRATHQINNFARFCEIVVKRPTIRNITLMTSYDENTNLGELKDRLEELKQSLLEIDVILDIKLNENMHDREIRLDNGWVIKIGRGLDFYQRPDSWFTVGAHDLSLRKCMETKVDIFKQ